MKITIYTTEYVSTEDGDRDIRDERSSTYDFESTREIAEYLVKHGLDRPCSGPDYHHTVRWSDEPYEHPEGYVVEKSAHRDEESVPDGVWREVWLRMTKPPADVLRHMVEEVILTVKPGTRYGNRPNPGDLPRMARLLIGELMEELDDSDDLRDVILQHLAAES